MASTNTKRVGALALILAAAFGTYAAGPDILMMTDGAGNTEKVTVGTTGKALVQNDTAAAGRSTLGLLSAATTASTDYATAAQGARADLAAIPADITDTHLLTRSGAGWSGTDPATLGGITVATKYNPSGGTILYDGTRYMGGFVDAFGDSATDAEWTDVPGAHTIVEATELTFNLANGSGAEWYSGTYTSPYRHALHRPAVNGDIIAHVTPQAAGVNGAGIVLHKTGDQASVVWVRAIVIAGVYKLQWAKSTGGWTIAETNVGGATGCWLRIRLRRGEVVYIDYYVAAAGSTPTEADWTVWTSTTAIPASEGRSVAVYASGDAAQAYTPTVRNFSMVNK